MATALTPLAFFDVLMLKTFRRLVNDDAEVSVETGLRAAEKLQAVLEKRDHGEEIIVMRLQVNQILDAVKAVVPQSMWGDIVDRLDQVEQHPEVLDVDAEDFDDDNDPYDPTEFIDEDDEF
jgi:hypothetical protein